MTAVLLMTTRGHGAEFNNLFSYLYESYGIACFVLTKLILVIVVLFAAYILSRHGGYWLINGWLTALCIGGIMAIISNLSSTYDIVSVNPYNVILCYLILTFVFLYIGDHIDTKKRNVKNWVKYMRFTIHSKIKACKLAVCDKTEYTQQLLFIHSFLLILYL